MPHTLQELLAAGRPASGYAVTHEPTVQTLEERRGLAFGFLREGQVRREFSWRRLTGNVRLETGAARQRFGDQPGKVIPAVLAVALQDLSGMAGGRCEGKDGGVLVDTIGRLAYSDVALLMLDRAIERGRGVVPLIDDTPCLACEAPVGAMALGRKDVQVAHIDWRPEAPPQAIAWLDEPFRYGEGSVEALIVQAVSWSDLYADARMADLQNREWTTVRSATSTVVGHVSGGQVRMAPIARSILCDKVADGDLERLSTAVFACSGGAQMGAIVEHDCGNATLVPFAWQRGA